MSYGRRVTVPCRSGWVAFAGLLVPPPGSRHPGNSASGSCRTPAHLLHASSVRHPAVSHQRLLIPFEGPPSADYWPALFGISSCLVACCALLDFIQPLPSLSRHLLLHSLLQLFALSSLYLLSASSFRPRPSARLATSSSSCRFIMLPIRMTWPGCSTSRSCPLFCFFFSLPFCVSHRWPVLPGLTTTFLFLHCQSFDSAPAVFFTVHAAPRGRAGPGYCGNGWPLDRPREGAVEWT